MATHAKLKRILSRLLSIPSAMKRLRSCVSVSHFAISESDSNTEATCPGQASETHHYVNFTVDSANRRSQALHPPNLPQEAHP